MRHPRRQHFQAWFVHLYTGLGLVTGLLALVAAADGRVREMFALLTLGYFIDATDGTLARNWKVKEWSPTFDGRKLDDIIDYLNYTFIPVFFIYHSGLVPAGWWPVMGLVLLASVYGFCQQAAKTDDGYFTGFPSYWNVYAFYAYVLNVNPFVNAALLTFLALWVFVPLKYLYPSQAPQHRTLNIVLACAWAIMLVPVLFQLEGKVDARLVYLSLFYPAYYMLFPLFLMLKPRLSELFGHSR